MSDRPPELPDARWGTAETPLPDWRDTDFTDADDADDDEELAETPPDVIAALGFDPLEADEDDLAQDAALAFDRSVRSYDANGHLHVAMTPISKANICEYYGHEIPDADTLGLDPNRRYRLYRDPDELAKAASTFNRLPILSRHQPVSADAHPKHLTVGTTGSEANFAHPYLHNSMSIWDADAIHGVESEDSSQLSAAYRYRADMTPGTVNGAPYDGVMRDIAGNHVALVPEGRAGADVVVGDAKPKELPPMPAAKPAATERMSRQALYVSAACAAYVLPQLAADQKLPDMRALLKGINAKTWKAKRSAFIAAFTKEVKPRLAQDDSIDALAALLNRLEVEAPGAPEEVQDPEPVEPVDPPGAAPAPGEEAKDHGGLPEQIAAKLEEWLTPEQMAELRAMAGGTTEEPAAEPPAPGQEEGQDQGNPENDDMQRRREEEDQNKVTKPAMDAAITAAVKAERERAIALREAERVVRPYIGDLAIAQDSADDVYRLALTTLGVKVDGVHPSAFRTILELRPPPSSGQPREAEPLGMDEAQAKSFAERFPGFDRLKAA